MTHHHIHHGFFKNPFPRETGGQLRTKIQDCLWNTVCDSVCPSRPRGARAACRFRCWSRRKTNTDVLRLRFCRLVAGPAVRATEWDWCYGGTPALPFGGDTQEKDSQGGYGLVQRPWLSGQLTPLPVRSSGLASTCLTAGSSQLSRPYEYEYEYERASKRASKISTVWPSLLEECSHLLLRRFPLHLTVGTSILMHWCSTPTPPLLSSIPVFSSSASTVACGLRNSGRLRYSIGSNKVN